MWIDVEKKRKKKRVLEKKEKEEDDEVFDITSKGVLSDGTM